MLFFFFFMATFEALGLANWVQEKCQQLRYDKPTQIQTRCIPPALAGCDVICCADTGAGKTACYCLPILQKWTTNPFGIYALILLPTRELATQVVDQFRAFGSGAGADSLLVVGGTDSLAQKHLLEQRPAAVVATPGRLAGLLQDDELLSRIFRRLRVVVFDEGDRLADQTMRIDMEQIMDVVPCRKEGIQTMVFSATVPDDKTVFFERFRLKQNAELVKLKARTVPPETILQKYIFIPHHFRLLYVAHLLQFHLQDQMGIVFVSTCRECEVVAQTLKKLDLSVSALHGALKPNQRIRALSGFRSELSRVLVATDLASRGLDIPKVHFVINYDLPMEKDTFIHRVGRSGRAGRKGVALTVVTQRNCERIQAMENKVGIKMEQMTVDDEEAMKSMNRVSKAVVEAQMALHDGNFESRLQTLKVARLTTKRKLEHKAVEKAADIKMPKKTKKPAAENLSARSEVVRLA